ncbi:uncharacterized protein TRAVEDRAFT_44832 [Trametes versicolor FP-101664 SS1]|uniref:uncharacterized protein n=1 Tax=Trametes versicolor (strain FP-101664) TaxID=717944 RepID=UPI0004622EBB|nr:uncharacterized protein TRAVEDRAFT_44832 [Trametes versicolor FP-101664 SS1]EIW62000.1 hypothetical protein TRAVEDRAFT_44832 [Trametes versicolor FP-101664 SS1]
MTVQELKTQSDSSFAFVNEARSSIDDVQTLRTTISTSLQGMAPYIEGGAEWTKVREMKNIMSTLELECSKSEQVADLLRDRLQSVGGELSEAMSRVTELEAAQAEDRVALSRANTAMTRTAEELSSIMAGAKKQQGELYDTLAVAAESEAKAQTATMRIQELQETLRVKDEELQALQNVRPEVARLQTILLEKNALIAKQESNKIQIPQLKATVNELEIRIAELTTLASSKEAAITDLQSRIAHMEAELDGRNAEAKTLAEELGTIKAREQTLTTDNGRLHDEKRTLTEKLDDLEATLARARQELETRSERLQAANARSQTFEERFEDQSVTLRITREAAGDAQERLLAAEMLHAKQLADVTARLEQEIAILREQKLGSQATIDVMNAALKRHERTLQVMQEEHADRLKEQSASHVERLHQEEKHLQQLVDNLADSRARIESSEGNVRRLEGEIVGLRLELKEAQLPSPETEAELRTLRSRVSTLEGAEMMNTVRAKTIESRYRTGDLNDEEKAFINTLVRTSQAIHEQELVANRNELRRRDNALKETRAKVHLLESTLAKHLTAPKPKPAPPTVIDHSMIDPTAWMSSGQSSSPVHAPDRDGQLDVDVVVPAKAAPVASRVGQITPAQTDSAQPQSALNRAQTLKGPVRKTPPTAGAATYAKRGNFSRLATDCSDEILDFDDDGVRKPSPTSSLGKRSKPSSPPQQADAHGIPKPLKRLRTTARKAEAADNDTSVSATSKRVVQPRDSKNRPRKRR